MDHGPDMRCPTSSWMVPVCLFIFQEYLKYACQVLKKRNSTLAADAFCSVHLQPAKGCKVLNQPLCLIVWLEEIMAVYVSAGTSQRECSVPVGLTTTPQSLRSTTPHSSSTCLSSTSASPSSSFFSATVAYSAQCAR